MTRRSAGLLFLALACGCGAGAPAARHASAPADDDRPPDIRAEPIRLRATGQGEQLSIDAYDAAGLFDRGAGLLRDGRCADAIAIYRRIAKEFPDSRYAPPALYNSGLCSEQLGDQQQAADDYRQLVERYPGSRDVTDALFRLAGAFEKLGLWAEARTTLDQILNERGDLEEIERVEALARKGDALIRLGERKLAAPVLEEAGVAFRTGKRISPSASAYYYAMAQFDLGEIVRFDMEEAPLPADEALIASALERKCALLLDAQKEYLKAIRIAQPHWAAAAAFRIGDLYRRLWDDMVAAPAPEDLNAEEREVYGRVLKDRILVLLKKAVSQWEKTMKMARRLSLSDEWIAQTAADLEAVRSRIASEEAASLAEKGGASSGGAARDKR